MVWHLLTHCESMGDQIYFIILILWGAMFIISRTVLSRQDKMIRGRKMSFMSEMMVSGTFPPAAGDFHCAITSAVFLKDMPDLVSLKQSVLKLFSSYKRFRSVPELRYWREVGIRIDDHFHYLEVENQSALDAQLEIVMNRALPTEKPRWEVIMIFNRELLKSDASTASSCPPYHVALVRVDHCIGDGVSLVEVFARFLTDSSGRPVGSEGLVGLRRTPSRVIKGIPATLAAAVGPYDSATPFSAPLEMRKKGLVFCRQQKLSMGGPWSLEYVKAVKTSLGISVNDLFMSAFSGAIRRYCIDEGYPQWSGAACKKKPQHPVLCRALLPFAFLRPHNDFDDPEAALTNNWTLVSTKLAVNADTRLDCVKATSQIMNAMKRKLRPLSSVLIRAIGCYLLPRSFFRQTLYDTYNRHSVVFANVPGPASKVYFGGCIVHEMQILFCGAIPQVEIFTYAGRVFFNLVADPKILAHPKKIVEYFGDELRAFGKDVGITTISLESLPRDDLPKKILLTN